MNLREHSPCIELNGKTISVKGTSDKKYRFAFAEMILNYSSWKWKVKVNKMKNWIGLGCCFKDEIIAGGYKYVKPLQHSTFIVSSNGYMWNCLNAEQNSDYVEKLQYDEGDTLEFGYDLEKKVLTCKFKSLVVELTKVKASLINFLVPCVILTDEGDEVQFLECD